MPCHCLVYEGTDRLRTHEANKHRYQVLVPMWQSTPAPTRLSPWCTHPFQYLVMAGLASAKSRVHGLAFSVRQVAPDGDADDWQGGGPHGRQSTIHRVHTLLMWALQTDGPVARPPRRLGPAAGRRVRLAAVGPPAPGRI
jgi:hypothetical protein